MRCEFLTAVAISDKRLQKWDVAYYKQEETKFKASTILKTSSLRPYRTVPRRGVLTLRRLMSYIYMEHPFLMFLDHTQRRSTVGRTPLDE